MARRPVARRPGARRRAARRHEARHRKELCRNVLNRTSLTLIDFHTGEDRLREVQVARVAGRLLEDLRRAVLTQRER